MKHKAKFGSSLCRFVLVLVVIMTLSLLGSACATEAPAKEAKDIKDIKIGFSMYAMNHVYFIVMKETGEEIAKEKGFQLITTSADLKIEKRLQDVEDLIANRCDVIMIDPVNPIGTRQDNVLSRLIRLESQLWYSMIR